MAIAVLVLILTGRRIEYLAPDQKIFDYALVSLMMTLAFDAMTWLVNGIDFPLMNLLNVGFSFLYWLSTLVPCYIGFLYTMIKVYDSLDKRKCLLMAVPIFFGEILLVMNFWTGWIFTVSEHNVYSRGPYFLTVGLLPYIHMLAVFIISVRKAQQVPVYERRKYYILSVYMLIPCAGSLLEIIFYGLDTIWPALTVSMLMCYIFIQSGDLSEDFLTGLNNRRRFDHYTRWKSDRLKGSATMFLLMIDVDRFKMINDTYGHAEGDIALVSTAHLLKEATRNRHAFLARIGGDEFAIILNNVSEQDVLSTISNIERMFDEENRRGTHAYTMTLSMGYAGMSGSNMIPFDKLFSRADAMMYENKEKKKAAMGVKR